jgi:CBS domain-containing protein
MQAEPQREWLSLVSARVRDTHLRPPFHVDGSTDLVEVCRQMQARGLTHALVRDQRSQPPRLGIFTTTDLRDALLRPQPPAAQAVQDVARFDLVEISADADLFEALWLMLHQRVHRLVVRDRSGPGAAEAPVLGVLSQLDLVSFVASHSHIVALQVDAAGTLAELQAAAARVDPLVRLLHDSGIRVERVMRLVCELNTRVLQRLWALQAPPELAANSCLLAMGSEGRGEQILKTDQDNALLLRDGFVLDGEAGQTGQQRLAALAERFNAALVQLGWPPCPGQIMLSHPQWRQPVAAFKAQIRQWVHGRQPEGPMHLAIFLDARVVAGDPRLLAEARAELDGLVAGQDQFLSRFAAAADQFAEPGGWFTRLGPRRDEQPLDLKKLGTFPIVHGLRALALQHGVAAASSAGRLNALVTAGQIDGSLARDLLEALHLLMGLRLTHQLREDASGRPAGNEIRPSALSTLEREALRDALAIVWRFRAWLRQHFHFD